MPTGTVIRRFWDSFCFIALLNDDEGADDCEKILNDAKEGKTQIVVSPVVQVEVVRPRGAPQPVPQEDKEKVKAFFENDYLKWRMIDRKIAAIAQDLCWQYGVHPRDALHLAAALDTNCHLLETTDRKMLGLEGRLTGSVLKITKPVWTGQPDLFIKQEEK